MSQIVAIGGGEIADRETERIDRYVRDLTGRDDPAALFVPTASGDAAGYCEAFEAHYGDRLGCRTRHLTLGDAPADAEGSRTDPERLRADLAWADLVYVGGGSVRVLLERWRRHDLVPLLREAHEDGTVVAGLSAGATCWFAGGLTDDPGGADERPGPDGTDYAPVDGLGWIDEFVFTPHAGPSRRAAFREFVSSRPETGLALEDGCAIAIALSDREYRVLSETGTEAAYRVVHREDGVAVEEIEATGGFRPIGERH